MGEQEKSEETPEEKISQHTQEWQTKRGQPRQELRIVVREFSPGRAIFYPKDELDESRHYRYRVVEVQNIIPIRPGHYLTQGRFEQLVNDTGVDVVVRQPYTESRSKEFEEKFKEIDGLYHELPPEEYRRFEEGKPARRGLER